MLRVGNEVVGVVGRLVERVEDEFLRLSNTCEWNFLWVTHVVMPCGHHGAGAMVEASFCEHGDYEPGRIQLAPCMLLFPIFSICS
jgi:hypothetical protein